MKPPTENNAAPTSAGRLRAYLMFIVLLIAGWVLWSGMFKPLLLGLGAFSCALVAVIAVRMGYFDSNTFALRSVSAGSSCRRYTGIAPPARIMAPRPGSSNSVALARNRIGLPTVAATTIASTIEFGWLATNRTGPS